MKAKKGKVALAIVVVLAGGGLALAETAATVAEGVTAQPFTAGVSVGWRFFVDSQITITHLGVFDQGNDGLASEHTIGIWRLPKTGGFDGPLRVADIGSGAASGGDGHVYVDIEDITLVPDPVPGPTGYYERWLIGVWSADDADPIKIPESAVTMDVIEAGYIHWEPLGGYTYDDDGPEGDLTPPWGETIWGTHWGINFQYTVASGPTPIEIDIKPGSYPNSINLGSNGVVPVAILSTADLDATTIDAGKVFLEGTSVAVRGKGNKLMAHEEDVNGDDLPDLVVQVETENLDPGAFQDGVATVTVENDTGEVIYEGSDEITIVPPE